MKRLRKSVAILLGALAFLADSGGDALAQFGGDAAVGQFYSIEPPMSAATTFDAVRIERVAPQGLVAPPPFDLIPIGIPLRALTGQILELPERQRLFFTGVDASGRLRAFEIDLIRREARHVVPPRGSAPPFAARMLATADGSKLYVQWYAGETEPPTNIYDGINLRWLSRTYDFRADERAIGFESPSPYLWTLNLASQPVLVDAQRDLVVNVFDYQRWFGPVPGVIADVWRDVLLVRLDAGHDRFQLVDVVSGEIGPPYDLEGYSHAQPRLVLNGRFLVLVDMERRPARGRSWAETAIALGGGTIHDLRNGGLMDEFRVVVPIDFPVSAVGTTTDPGLPGRLWIHVPGDQQRFDFELPGCRRNVEGKKGLEAFLDSRWNSGSGADFYRYRVRVDASSQLAAGAMAVEAGRETDRTTAPDGWGVDLVKRDQWVRWTNALGPAEEDIEPGMSLSAFVVAAREETRPGIVEYRIQAATGLPRGCESDDRFLKNGVSGYTLGPERVETIDPRKLAQRLEKLVDRACDIGWVGSEDCPSLESAAEAVESARTERTDALDRFLEALLIANLRDEARVVLSDAAAAIREVLEPSP